MLPPVPKINPSPGDTACVIRNPRLMHKRLHHHALRERTCRCSMFISPWSERKMTRVDAYSPASLHALTTCQMTTGGCCKSGSWASPCTAPPTPDRLHQAAALHGLTKRPLAAAVQDAPHFQA